MNDYEKYIEAVESRKCFDTPSIFDFVEALNLKDILYVFPYGSFLDVHTLTGQTMDVFEFSSKCKDEPMFVKKFNFIVCASKAKNKIAMPAVASTRQVGRLSASFNPEDISKSLKNKKYIFDSNIERLAFGNIVQNIKLIANSACNVEFSIKLYDKIINSYKDTFIACSPALDKAVNKMLTRLVDPVEERNLEMQARRYLRPSQVKKFLNILWRLGLAKALLNKRNNKTYWKLTKPIEKIDSVDIADQLSEIIG